MTLQITGNLIRPIDGLPVENATVEFIAASGSLTVLEHSKASVKTDANGFYDLQLEYGHYEVWVREDDTLQYMGYCIVNESSPSPMSLQELIKYTQPIPVDQVEQLDDKWDKELNDLKNEFDTEIREVKDQVVDGDAAVVTQMTTYTNDRLGQEMAQMTDQINAGDAQVLNQATAYTDTKGNELASDITQLETDQATLRSEMTSVTEANGTAIAQLRTDMEAGDAALSQSAKAYTDTETGLVEARVTQALQAGDAQLTQDLQVTKDELGNHQANWQVEAQVTDLTSSIGMVNDGTTSEVYVVAEAFKFYDSAGSQNGISPFTVANGKVYADHIILGSNSGMDYDNITGTKPPSDATHGATQDQIDLITGAQNSADQAQSNFQNFVDGVYADDQAAIAAQVDSKAETWVQLSTDTDPKTNWYTQEIRDRHDKDTLYLTDTKKMYFYSSADHKWNIVEDQAAIDAMDSALLAQASADGKVDTYYQTTAPRPVKDGDIWVDLSDGDRMYFWDESINEWRNVNQEALIEQMDAATRAIANAVNAQATADGKIETYFQDEAPATASEGDIWFDTNDGNKQYVYQSGSWVIAQDQEIGKAIADAAGAQATADGKVTTFYQDNTPTPEGIGDLWVDTNDGNKLYRWSGTQWEDIQDAAIRQAQDTANEVSANLSTAVADLQGQIDDLSSQVDGQITSWFYEVAPTMSNPPAVDWTTDALKDEHLSDLYYDTVTGKAYRFVKVDNVYSWAEIPNSEAAQALAAAAAAQDTADSKRRVFVATPYPPYDIGDLWTDQNDLKLCVVSRNKTDGYVAADWVQATSYKADISSLNTNQSQQALEIARLDGDISAEEAARIQAILDEESARASDVASLIAADAAMDGKITAEEAARIQQGQDLEAAYKAYSDTVAQALIDGEISDAEANAIAEAQKNIDAAELALQGQIDDNTNDITETRNALDAVDLKAGQNALDIAAVDGRVTAEEAARIAAINAEQAARIEQNNALIAEDAALDGKITAEEAARIQQGQDLEVAYKNYSDTVAQALIDGEISDAEAAAIAEAQRLVTEAETALQADIDKNTGDLTNFIDVVYANDQTNLQNQLDGKVETWYLLSTDADPKDSWTTNELKLKHDGDMKYLTDTSELSYYDAGTHDWIKIEDADAIAAMAAAQSAQETADGKIVTFYQDTVPTPEGVGDLWFDTDNDNEPKRWNGTQWVSARDTSVDQALADANAALIAAEGAQAAADGKITAFYQNTPPQKPDDHYTEGDIWVDIDDGNKMYYAQADDSWVLMENAGIGEALDAAQTAQTIADGKAEIFYSDTQPNGKEGDLWVNTAQNMRIYRMDAHGIWESLNEIDVIEGSDNTLNAIADALKSAATADGKIVTFFEDEEPTKAGEGDIWFDTNDGNKQYVYQSGEWVVAQDQGIGEAIQAAAGAQATADGKVTTFYQDEAPVAEGEGDLWVDTDNGNILYRWSGAAWIEVTDQRVEKALNDAAQGIIDAANAAALADGKIDIFYQDNSPDAKEGDIWVDTDNGNEMFRLENGSWVSIQDEEITKALNDAAKAQSTADGKATIFFQDNAPNSSVAQDGDIWIDSNDGNRQYTMKDDVWVDTSDARMDQALADAAQAINDAASADAKADGKIDVFYQSTDPYQYAKEGDIWYDTGNKNKSFRRNGNTWRSIQDEDIHAALEAASHAQATADGKTTTFYQDTAPSAADEGDSWITSTGDYYLYRSGTWELIQIGDEIDYDDDRISNDKLTKDQVIGSGIYPSQDGEGIQSANYSIGSAGWKIDNVGNAEFNNVIVRGEVYASRGTFNGEVNATLGNFSGKVTIGTPNGYEAFVKATSSDTHITFGTKKDGAYTWFVRANGEMYSAGGADLHNATIHESCQVLGTVYAENIEGDVLEGGVVGFPSGWHRNDTHEDFSHFEVADHIGIRTHRGFPLFGIALPSKPYARTVRISGNFIARNLEHTDSIYAGRLIVSKEKNSISSSNRLYWGPEYVMGGADTNNYYTYSNSAFVFTVPAHETSIYIHFYCEGENKNPKTNFTVIPQGADPRYYKGKNEFSIEMWKQSSAMSMTCYDPSNNTPPALIA